MPIFRTLAFTRYQARALTAVAVVLATSTLFSCGSSTSGTPAEGSAGAAVAGAQSAAGSQSVGGDAHGGSSSAGAAGLSSGGAAGSAVAGSAGAGGVGVGGVASGGHAGTGGAAGAGGMSASACPAAAPSNAVACSAALQGNTCYYDDCSGLGRRTKATCVFLNAGAGSQGMWSVETSPCGDLVACGGDGASQACPVGQACLVMEGGALITQCADHTCGSGPIECDCVKGCVPGCVKQGFTFTCNTCSDPRGCP